MNSCNCNSGNLQFHEFTQKKKEPISYKIEGYKGKKIKKNDLEYFTNKYKLYLHKEEKKDLDKNARTNFMEMLNSTIEGFDASSYDASFNEVNKLHTGNLDLRADMDNKLNELNNTLTSSSYENEMYINYLHVKELMVVSVTAVLLYYIFIEL